MQKEMKEKVSVQLAALNPYVQINQQDSKETEKSGQKFIEWGSGNFYPHYLRRLYEEVPSLQSIIESCVDYISGDEVSNASPNFNVTVNRKGELFEDFFQKIALDLIIFGGFAIQVIRSKAGNVLEMYHVPLQWTRLNREGDVVYINKEFGEKRYGQKTKTLEYPIFAPSDTEIPTSVYYYKGKSQKTYPVCSWNSAVLSAELERQITLFHSNNLENAFNASAIISFNNGQPNEEQADEIEKRVNEKFAGYENAGRILLNWSDSKDNAPTIVKMDSNNFGEMYESLAKRVREQIFAAFRMNPNLAGIATENLGFNSEEFDQAFKLFNKTFVQPRQKVLQRAISSIIGSDVIIKPFTINFQSNNETNPIL